MTEPEQLILEHFNLARRQAFQFCRESRLMHLADEMESAALYALVKAARAFRGESKFSTFAFACIRNELIMTLRAHRRQDKIAAALRRNHSDADVRSLDDEVAIREIVRHVRGLSAAQRETIRVCYAESDSPNSNDAWRLLGVPKTTAYWRHVELLADLKKHFRRPATRRLDRRAA